MHIFVQLAMYFLLSFPYTIQICSRKVLQNVLLEEHYLSPWIVISMKPPWRDHGWWLVAYGSAIRYQWKNNSILQFTIAFQLLLLVSRSNFFMLVYALQNLILFPVIQEVAHIILIQFFQSTVCMFWILHLHVKKLFTTSKVQSVKQKSNKSKFVQGL